MRKQAVSLPDIMFAASGQGAEPLYTQAFWRASVLYLLGAQEVNARDAARDVIRSTSLGLAFMVTYFGPPHRFTPYQKEKWNELCALHLRYSKLPASIPE